MAKTWTREDNDKAAEFDGGLNAFYAGGYIRALSSGDTVLLQRQLHATAPFSVTSGVATLQKSGGGGFNGEEFTYVADGTIAKVVLVQSDGTTLGRTGTAAITGSGGAADAVYTGNTLTVISTTPFTFSQEITITPA